MRHPQGTHGERLRYFDTLTVPIIDNTTHEADLTTYMERAIEVRHVHSSAMTRARHC